MMQFLVGLGAGGATFVRQLSAWTLGSIGGFSNASSRVLARALQTQPAARFCCEYSCQFCDHPALTVHSWSTPLEALASFVNSRAVIILQIFMQPRTWSASKAKKVAAIQTATMQNAIMSMQGGW